MKDIEAACVEGNSLDKFKAFVANNTVPCDRKDATPMRTFKAKVAQELGVDKVQAGVTMNACGYNRDGMANGKDRVATGFRPARGEAKGDGLKLKDVAC